MARTKKGEERKRARRAPPPKFKIGKPVTEVPENTMPPHERIFRAVMAAPAGAFLPITCETVEDAVTLQRRLHAAMRGFSITRPGKGRVLYIGKPGTSRRTGTKAKR